MGKTILITGASSGIGKATARFFQERDWNVVATMRTPERETELTELDRVLVTKLDVQEKQTMIDAIDSGINTFGKIDALLNNAGYGAYGVLEAASSESIKRQFDVNVIGLLETTKAILPHFRKNKSGVIVNISSIGGKMTFPYGALYHGSKFAVEGISESLSFELSQINCKVKIVEPGMINTDFGGRSLEFINDENLTEYQESINNLMQGLGAFSQNASEPEVVAGVIYEAVTDGSDRLRYTAGDDAEMIVENRKQLTDEAFIGNLREQFGF